MPAKFYFDDPSRPIRIPPLAYVRALASILAHRLLPLKWSSVISVWAARVRLRLSPRRRLRRRRFLQAYLPQGAGERELWRASCLSVAIRRLGAGTYAPVFRRSERWLRRTFRPEGLEHLEEAKRAGRGAIILATGAGFKLWAAPILRRMGYPTRLMQRQRVAAETLILMRWEGVVADVLPYPDDEESGAHLKRLYDLVKSGAWIRHVGQNPGHENPLRGRFLGAEIQSGRGPWLLGRMTGAPLIPVAVLMDRDYRFRLIVGAPIHVGDAAAADAAMAAAFQSYLDFVHRHVLRMPWNFTLPSYWEDVALAR